MKTQGAARAWVLAFAIFDTATSPANAGASESPAAGPTLTDIVYEQRLLPADALSASRFGAALDCAGEWLAIGAPKSNIDGGAVTLFRRSETNWQRAFTLLAPVESVATFGRSVAVSGDDLFVADRSQVFAYTFNGLDWVGRGSVPIADGIESPVLDADAEHVVITSLNSIDSIQVLSKSGGKWSTNKVLLASPALHRSGATDSLALGGNLIAIGTDLDDALGRATGRVVVFDIASGSTFDVPAPLPRIGGSFGTALALHEGTLAVADVRDRVSLAAASVYVFDLKDGRFAFRTSLSASTLSGADHFGLAVAMNASTLAVGAPSEIHAGTLVLYPTLAPTEASGQQQSYSGAAENFGAAIALCGSSVLVSAPLSSETVGNMLTSCGAVHALRVGNNHGAACSLASDCLSNHCVDGRCCNLACTATCFACSIASKGHGTDGICEPTAANRDPRNECSPEPMCGNTGDCDGAGHCAVQPVGVTCAPATCPNEGMEQPPSFCDGSGNCAISSPEVCSDNLACKNGSCLSRCIDSSECQSGSYCSAWTCIPKIAVGTRCDSAEGCASGYCVNSTCCESECSEPCAVCSYDGSCRARAAGSESAACFPLQCDGIATRCPSGCHGDADCARDYFCQSSGQCAPRRSRGESCAMSECLNSDCHPCAGSGVCIDGQCCTRESADACMALGEPCANSQQCARGFCVDGVCCDSNCHGQCESCAEPTATGRCTAVIGTPRAQRPACWSNSEESPCASRTCDGINRKQCAGYVGAEIVCRARACVDGRQSFEARCDGAGRCSNRDSVSCFPYRCGDDGACRNACGADAHCSPGNHCSAGECVSGNTCVDRSSMMDALGYVRYCHPYLCVEGSCASNCVNSYDCAIDSVCDPVSSRCVARDEQPSNGCSLTTRRLPNAFASLLGLVAAGLLFGGRFRSSSRRSVCRK